MTEYKKFATKLLADELHEIKRSADSAHFIVGQLFNQFFIYDLVDTLEEKENIVYKYDIALEFAKILLDCTFKTCNDLETLETISDGEDQPSSWPELLACEAKEIRRHSDNPAFLLQAAYKVGLERGSGEAVSLDRIRMIAGSLKQAKDKL